jgi:hypothetical protein
MSEGWCACTRSYPTGFDRSGCPVHDRPDEDETGDLERRLAVAEKERDNALNAVKTIKACYYPAPQYVELELAHGKAEARVAVLETALQEASRGMPDPMHPEIPRKFVDNLVSAQIVISAALGHEDPGDVEAARAALNGVGDE